jgi:AcrR family transcriptional regulator
MGRHRDPIRREELLDAVARYILDAGLAGLSLRPLAAELATSPRILLYHFGSKEALLTEALGRIRHWQQQAAAAWLSGKGDSDPASVLRRAWAWLSSAEAAPFMRLFFEVYGLAVQHPSRYADFLEHVVSDWLPLAAAVVEQAEPRERATLLIATHRGLLLDLLATGDTERIAASHERLIADLGHERAMR